MNKCNGLIAASLLGLTACGGSGGGSSTVIVDGVFKDSNVSGLAYESGGQTGVTDVLGAFRYEEGQDVSFNIGALELGTGAGMPVMTPIDLVEDGKLASAGVINRVRFLMMLDKDNMPSNGIEISDEVQEVAEGWTSVDFAAADFPSQAVNDFRTKASVADGIVHDLPDADAASAHLRTTLLCANAGAYVGSYDGTESGNIALAINPINGEVNGSSYDSTNDVSSEVSNTTALDFDSGLSFVSGNDVTQVFSGTVDSTESISGDWQSSADATQNGNFDVNRLGGASDAVFRYTVTFVGSDQGVITFDVDDSNNVSGVFYSVSTQEESSLTGTLVDDVLTAKAEDETVLNALLDTEALSLDGVWTNVGANKAGTYVGGGCRLN